MPMGTIREQMQLILELANHVERNLAGKNFDDFAANSDLTAAVERYVERISAAVGHVPQSIQIKHPSADWDRIALIGNRLRHVYDRELDQKVWQLAKKKYPRTKTRGVGDNPGDGLREDTNRACPREFDAISRSKGYIDSMSRIRKKIVSRSLRAPAARVQNLPQAVRNLYFVRSMREKPKVGVGLRALRSLLLALLAAAPAAAESLTPVGIWLHPNQRIQVEIGPCGETCAARWSGFGGPMTHRVCPSSI